MPIREARKLHRQLQEALLTGLSRTFESIPADRLDQVMRTPLRRVILDAMFWGLPRFLASTRAHEVTPSVRCHVTGRGDGGYDVFWIEHFEGRWRTGRGAGAPRPEPELTVTVDATELLLLARGDSTPFQSYLAGKLRASGNPKIAARLTTLFRAAPEAG
jgi:hypothetical protein